MREGAPALDRLGPAGRIGRTFINSKLTPLMVVAALGVGIFAVVFTPREEEPQIIVPIVDLMIGFPGAAPAEIESRITVPLERRLWQIPGVEYLYSTSLPEGALITVRFEVGEDVEGALVKVYERVASGLDQTPLGVTEPLMRLRSIDDVPILAVTLNESSASSSVPGHDRLASSELRRVAGELRRHLAALDEVADVRLIGGQRRTIRIELDRQALAIAGLDALVVADLLRAQNSAVIAGSYSRGNDEILVESGAFLSSAADFDSIVVGLANGRPVFLHQVAEVLDGPDEIDSTVWLRTGSGHLDGISDFRPAVTISVAKRKGADAARVAQEVLETLERLRPALIPADIEMTVTRDYGETADQKASELLQHLILAILSVSFLIGLALGWRGALVVLISVPVSFALTLFVYYVFGYTLNRVTLFALIFVTGIVVDDSIIVVENIVRHLARFSSRRGRDVESGTREHSLLLEQTAIEAVNEVGNPTILATLTVIAAVLPMAFVRGLMGPYMEPMPTGASLAMGFSLFVALIIVPWFAFRLLRPEPTRETRKDAGGGFAVTEEEASEATDKEGVDPTSRGYELYRKLMLPMLLDRRRGLAMIAIVALMLLGAIAMVPLGLVKLKMLPFDNKSELQIIIDMPEGTTLETTTAVARDLSEVLVGQPEVVDVELYAGTAAPVSFNGLVRHYDLRSKPHQADLQVTLVPKDQRSTQSHPLAKGLREPLQAIALRHGAAIKVVEVPPGPPVLSTLVAEIYGPEEEDRHRLASEVLEIFHATPDVVDVDWTFEDAQTTQRFVIDRERAARSGIQPIQVSRLLRLALSGESTGLLHRDREDETVPIVVRLPRGQRSSLADLLDLRIATSQGGLVPLGEVVDIEEAKTEQPRFRKNLRPVSYVFGEAAGASESPVYVILEMKKKIAKLEGVSQYFRDEPPPGAELALKWDGEWHITYEVFRDLGAAFGLVLVLIYVLLIGWFHSFRTPLVMMVAIPLGLIGVLPGHLLFGAFFTATSMIGFIALAGIMVRNSVLLIDFVHEAEKRGSSLGEAVVAAGAIRFRPILLTAGTVVVGAIVILFDPIFQGLAIALMFGALASTALTLVVVPVLHFLVEQGSYEQPIPENWLRTTESSGVEEMQSVPLDSEVEDRFEEGDE